MSGSNTIFVAGHQHNVYRMRSGAKDWEGKSVRTTARYLVYCTSRKSPRVPHWDLGSCLQGGHAYVVACVAGFRSPGIEGYMVDWLLENVVSLPDPVALPSGVGRHPSGFFGTAEHLQLPFLEVAKQVRDK